MPARLSHILATALLLATTLVCGSLGIAPAAAAQDQRMSRVFVPAPPKGKGDKCVADTDFMRRNHMTLLEQQRNGTVRDGIRTDRFSLKKCVECHAIDGPDGRPLTAKSPKFFCRECHTYAAVKIDCFECHASRPDMGKAAGLKAEEKERSDLASFLASDGKESRR